MHVFRAGHPVQQSDGEWFLSEIRRILQAEKVGSVLRSVGELVLWNMSAPYAATVVIKLKGKTDAQADEGHDGNWIGHRRIRSNDS